MTSKMALDPDKFLCAPMFVMEETLKYIKKNYGSVEGYLDSIGFDDLHRRKLKDSLMGTKA